MCVYYDVRFKFPLRLDGVFSPDVVVFGELMGYRRFCVGVNPDRSFSYLKIYNERGGSRFESDLSNIGIDGIESLIHWRLTTPAAVLNSMAIACLGSVNSNIQYPQPKRVLKYAIDDASFSLPISRLGGERLDGAECVVLIEKSLKKCVKESPSERELVIFTLADEVADWNQSA